MTRFKSFTSDPLQQPQQPQYSRFETTLHVASYQTTTTSAPLLLARNSAQLHTPLSRLSVPPCFPCYLNCLSDVGTEWCFHTPPQPPSQRRSSQRAPPSRSPPRWS